MTAPRRPTSKPAPPPKARVSPKQRKVREDREDREALDKICEALDADELNLITAAMVKLQLGIAATEAADLSPPAHELSFTRWAFRDALGMPRPDAVRIFTALEAASLDPLNTSGAAAITNRDGYRLRFGVWRAIYLLDEGRMILTAIKAEKR